MCDSPTLESMVSAAALRPKRTVRAPQRYSPLEEVEDDFATDDYDDGIDVMSSDLSSLSESEDDSEGELTPTLQAFIVDDDDATNSDCASDSDWDPEAEQHPDASSSEDTEAEEDELIATEDLSQQEEEESEVNLLENDDLMGVASMMQE